MTRQHAAPQHLSEQTFTAVRTREILAIACHAAGLDDAGAVLIRHHTNAVYKLASAPVVVKVGRPNHVGHIDVVGLVRWLEKMEVPTVALVDTDQPLQIAGCPVTFWRYMDQERGISSAAELAQPLAQLHSCPTESPIGLPNRHIDNTLVAITNAIETSEILTPRHRSILSARRDALVDQAAAIRFPLSLSVIHGDAQHRNALWDSHRGHAVLCDWESAALGPPEWDLVTIEIHCRRFGHPATEFAQFCEIYGFDIRSWSGFPWLRDLRELRMITTNARKSRPGSTTADEVLRRIGALDVGTPIAWNIL
ncbi:phosphotransferase family protein [Nocardia goodfellowii]